MTTECIGVSLGRMMLTFKFGNYKAPIAVNVWNQSFTLRAEITPQTTATIGLTCLNMKTVSPHCELIKEVNEMRSKGNSSLITAHHKS